MKIIKKSISFIFLLIISLSLISALNVQVNQLDNNEVLIPELGNSVSIRINITNLGNTDEIQLYNLVGFNMEPEEKISLPSGKSTVVELILSPIGQITQRGHFSMTYFIMGKDGSSIQEKISFKIIDLKDSFEVGSGNIDPQTNSITLYIWNKENFNFGNVKAKFSSPFFELNEEFTLLENQKKEFTIQLDKEKFKELMAGFYTLKVQIETNGKIADVEGVIKFVEKDLLTTTSESSGFIINTETIKKVNEGNVILGSETLVKKNIISRLFTTVNPEPDSVERQGATIFYTWSRSIKPGETLEITVKTNWFFPLLIILLLVIIVVLLRLYTTSTLILRKKVNFVRAKGGEFALKVSIYVQAKKYVERVNIIDRLPPLVKMYEKFGSEQPTRIDEKNRRVEWNFERLESGEKRILSYIIYSKVGVLGRFILPTATAVYEKDGEIKESESNRAFFVAEQRNQDIQEE